MHVQNKNDVGASVPLVLASVVPPHERDARAHITRAHITRAHITRAHITRAHITSLYPGILVNHFTPSYRAIT